MTPKLKKLSFFIFFFIIMTFPYIIASEAAGSSNIFGGFLLNPIDGNSYLAKMQQGYSGSWLFTLPYTHMEGNGVFLFAFYLFLGHAARWTGLSLILVFHAARIISVGLFLVSLNQFLKKFVPAEYWNEESSNLSLHSTVMIYSLILCCLGSGLGWIASFAGLMTADLWVAEAYPFLSSFTSPHFTLGMALLLWLLASCDARTIQENLKVWILGILLAVVMPFGAVAGGIVIAVNALWNGIETRKWVIGPVIGILAGAGVIVLAQYWQVRQDPLLANWNSQNVTPSPPVWNLVISYAPALIFAFAGVDYLHRRGWDREYRIIIVWLFTSILLVLFPFSLQRRFMFAQYIPVALLSVPGIFLLAKQRFKKVFLAVLFFSVLTNVLLVFSGLMAVKGENHRLVLQSDEKAALTWLEANTENSSLVMSSPTFGNFIPAYAGNRVLYGHPFETPNAEMMEVIVTRFYSGQMVVDDERSLLQNYDVDWVIYGPRERELGKPEILKRLNLVHQSGSVSIYEAIENQ